MEFLVQLTSQASGIRSNSMGMGDSVTKNQQRHDSMTSDTSSLQPLSNHRASSGTSIHSSTTTTSDHGVVGDNGHPPLDRLPIHGRHTCDSCKCTPIVGKRYHGTTGNLITSDVDLCDKCHAGYQEGGVARFVVVDLEERDVPFQDLWHRRRMRWREAGLRTKDMDFSLQEVERQLHQLKLQNQLTQLNSKANELLTTQRRKHPDEVSIISPSYSYQDDETKCSQLDLEEDQEGHQQQRQFDIENVDAAAKEFQFSLGEEWFQFCAQLTSKSDPQSKISEVHMFNGSINDENTERLANALLHDKKISTLRIQSNRFSRKAADTFKGLFQEPTTIHNLDFSFNRITGTHGIESIASVLPYVQNLRELFLRDCGIGDDGIKTLVVGGLKTNTTLRVLDLWRNNISDEGAEALGTISFFRRKSAFKILYMGCNKIGDVGAQRLTAGLRHSSNLQCLNLSINRISDDGAIAIGSLIPRMKRLKMLVLSRNMIGDQGAAGVAEGLATQTSSVVLLDLSSNRISDLGAKLVGKMLQQNGGLQKLFLHSNKFKLEGERALMTGIKQNVLLNELDVYLFPNEDGNSEDHMENMSTTQEGSTTFSINDSERSSITRSTAMSTPSSTLTTSDGKDQIQ